MFEINFDRQLKVDYVLMQLAFKKTRVKLNCKNMHTILNWIWKQMHLADVIHQHIFPHQMASNTALKKSGWNACRLLPRSLPGNRARQHLLGCNVFGQYLARRCKRELLQLFARLEQIVRLCCLQGCSVDRVWGNGCLQVQAVAYW